MRLGWTDEDGDWERVLLLPWRRGYVVLEEGDDEDFEEDGEQKEGWWSILLVGVGNISNLYIPISDMDVLGELDTKSFPSSQYESEVWEEGLELDDL